LREGKKIKVEKRENRKQKRSMRRKPEKKEDYMKRNREKYVSVALAVSGTTFHLRIWP
jgi:hypothetical protein